MAKVIITKSLSNEVNKKFKLDSIEIFELMYSLRKNPKKGKTLGWVSEFVIKEIRYNKFRFCFITDGRTLRFGTENDLLDLVIKFARMSDKKSQQKVISEIKETLKSMGFGKL